MCHAACLPAPNTAILCTCCRRVKMSVAARAVRNAVNSSTARKAYGVPEGENSVSEPYGVVLRELAVGDSVSLRLAIELEKDEVGEERELERSRLAMEGVLEDEGVWEACELE